MGPLGAQPNFPKPDLLGTYPDTWLSWLESQVWRCGIWVHACSKLEAQVVTFVFIDVDILLVHFIVLSINLPDLIIPQLKNKPRSELQ